MKLSAIWAESSNGVIGKNNSLPWSIPEELKHFQRVTGGSSPLVNSTVIMGRNTWDSLPAMLRNRENFVVTSRPIDGVQCFPSLGSACNAIKTPKAFIIGGAQLYAAAMPLVSEIFRSVLHDIHIPIDEHTTLAPALPAGFEMVSEEVRVCTKTNNLFLVQHFKL